MHRAILLFLAWLCAALSAATAATAATGEEKQKELVPTPESPLTATVNVDRLNVRQGPGTAFPILGRLDKGDEVVARRAVAEAGEDVWYECDYPARLAVWISAKYVETATAVEDAAFDSPAAGVVARSGVRMRNRPSLRSTVLGERQRDDEVGVVRSFNGWYQVLAPEDMRCYLHADYVDLAEMQAPWKPGPAEVEVDELLPLEPELKDASPDPRSATGPTVPATEPGRGDDPEAMERVGLARELLSGVPSLHDAERALRLLERALASRAPGGGGRVREQVRDVIGGLEPGVWLSLFEKARAEREAELEAIGRRYEAGSSGEDAPAAEIEYTASGLLHPPTEGARRYRLMYGEALLYEVEAGEADLSPFVGKGVGVVGEVRTPERPGEAPWIVARYVEETGPRRPGSLVDPTGPRPEDR